MASENDIHIYQLKLIDIVEILKTHPLLNGQDSISTNLGSFVVKQI